MLPFEFVIDGTPISQQTRRAATLQAWKTHVQSRAAACWPAQAPPVTDRVRIVMVYFYEGSPLDVDNMIKPVCDALVGLVYVDDRQIDDTAAHRRCLDGSFKVRGMSRVLADAFCSGREFLYVRVQDPLDPEVLL